MGKSKRRKCRKRKTRPNKHPILPSQVQAVKNKTMEQRKVNQEIDGIERRYISTEGMELRKSETGAATLRGYALRFGSKYDMGWFTEEIAPEALKNANMSDVRVLLNHDPNHILGRTKSGTARVGVDSVGMWYEVDLPDSPNGQNARVAIERGDINQSSWGFMLNHTRDSHPDKWEMRDGKDHRTILDVKTVFDASPVVFPANPDTSIAKRSRDMALEEIKPEETPEQVEEQISNTNWIDIDLELLSLAHPE